MSKTKRSIFSFLKSSSQFLGPIGIVLLLIAAISVFGCNQTQQRAAQETPSEPNTAPVQPSSAPSAYTVKNVTNGGTIEGRVILNGKPIPPRPVLVNQDANVCGAHRLIYPVKVENGGIVDAVVWIDDIHEGKPYSFPPAVLNQKKCTYDPHVVVMQPGDLKVTTEDPVPHNIHTYSEANRAYNESMNPLNREITLHFPRPERITFKCDLHGWMEAFIVVGGNPYYAVTQAGGKFQLSNVPAGTYRLRAWQETLGEVGQTVTVEAGKTAKVNLQLQSANVERAEVQ